VTTALALVVFAYLLGSLSPSLILGKLLRGIDLREHGSGNVGATNSFRVLGRGLGSVVLAADLFKGFLPVLLARLLTDPWTTVLVALFAIAGHNYSLFLRGRGGKGVATGAGTVLAMLPTILAVQLAVWAVILLLTGYVSLASVVAVALFPVLAAATGQPPAYLVFSLAGSLVVLWAHRSNMRRLASGTERRAGFRWFRRSAGKGSHNSGGGDRGGISDA
jgi:acyl phosphate:glycerol-3-phosphate acyltransferase